MADRVARLTNLLLLLLRTPEPQTFEQISFDIEGGYLDGESGRRQFERDKETLRREGIPIESTKRAGEYCYRIPPEQYHLPDLQLTPEERIALNVAVTAVRFDGVGEQQLSWRFEPHGQDMPLMAAIPAVEALPQLFDAVRRRAFATFTYAEKERRLAPYGLLFRGGFWYVIGRDATAREQRTYRVDRISTEVNVGRAAEFERPPNFDVAAALPSDPKLIGTEPRVEARVAVDSVMGPKVFRELGLPPRAIPAGERFEVSVPVVNRDAFRSWVLGMGAHAVVLGPPDLRADLVAHLRSVAATGTPA